MSDLREELVRTIFLAALDKTEGPERDACLAQACGQDVQLRERVDELLRVHSRAGDFLETPVPGAAELVSGSSTASTESTGDRIGPYRLLQQIGEGGCGVVYMAEQEGPIRRRVALKVIKLGMDTRQVIGRFEAERQALALMDHPNIARVLDAGATQTGRPYFVMELVRGIKITEYCDENNLSTEERLDLFIQICHAIQHAHQKGIIHRDLKPSNILVTLLDGQPVPKIIDFGIAKATGGQVLTDKTLFTAFEQFIGTPAYMSPEQAELSALDVDTRSDIYALGVLLYELLTGKTPFDQKTLAAAGLDEMRRIIRETEPDRPSTRLGTLTAAEQTTVAKCRHVQPPQLIHSLRGDLDWIVMKALEKDRRRRYETADGLANDIVRHLSNEPVTARPPAKLYNLQKLVRRNKGLFVAGTGVVLALVLGLSFSLWTLAKERVARQQALAAERKAEAEAAKSQQVAQFLKEMLGAVGPSVALGRDTTLLREILDNTAERVGKDLKDHPEVEAELRTTLGDVYEALGQYEKAEGMYRAALALQRGLWGNMSTNVADVLERLGWELLFHRIKIVESEPLLQEALMIRTNLLGAEHVQVATLLHHLGEARLWQGRARAGEGEELFRQSLAMRRRLLGNENLEVAQSLAGLGRAQLDFGKPDQAEVSAREALAIEGRLLRDERSAPEAGYSRMVLGVALGRQGKLEEAETMLRQAVKMRRDLLGGEHPNVALAMDYLAHVLALGPKLDEAERVGRDALALSRRTLGDQHPFTGVCLESLGVVLQRAGRFAESETACREALAIWRSPGIMNVNVEGIRWRLFDLVYMQGKFAEAEVLCRENVEDARKLPSAERLPFALLVLREVLSKQDKLTEAEQTYRQAVEAARKLPDSDTQVLVFIELGDLVSRFGRPADAEALYREGLQLCHQSATNYLERWQPLATGLGLALRRQGKFAEAESLYLEIVENVRRLPSSKRLPVALIPLGEFLVHQGRAGEAEAMLAEALETQKQLPASATMDDALGLLAMKLAALQVWFGQEANHTALCQRLLQWAAEKEEPGPPERAAKITNLRPQADPQLSQAALALARRSVEVGQSHAALSWYQLGLGLAEFRNGHYLAADRTLSAVEQDTNASLPAIRAATAKFYRAMSLTQQGQKAEAHQLFTEAEANMKPLPAPGQWPLTEGIDHDDLILWLAYKEARALLNPPPND